MPANETTARPSPGQDKFLGEWKAEYGVRDKKSWFSWDRKQLPNLPPPSGLPALRPPNAIAGPNYLGKATGFEAAPIGSDTGVAVTSSHDLPWRAICRVDVRYSDNHTGWGTGFLIDPGVVFTAGHVVFSDKGHGKAAELTITAGLTSQYPGSPLPSETVRYDDRWPQTFAEKWDYGAVILPNR